MTLYKTNNPDMDYAVIKRKGKSVVVRMWYNGWFPTHPVKDVDVKAKGWNKEYGTCN